MAKSNNPEIILLPMEIEFQVASCEDLNDEKRIIDLGLMPLYFFRRHGMGNVQSELESFRSRKRTIFL